MILLHYPVDGKLMTVIELHALIPHVSKDALRQRLIAGWTSMERLSEPPSLAHQKRAAKRVPKSRDDGDFVFIPPPCPLNAAFRAWTHTTRGRALQSLGVQTNPLRGAL